MLPLLFMWVEMLLCDNSVLKIYLECTIKFQYKSFDYFILFICFRKQFVGKLIHDLFHILPALIPPSISCINLYLCWEQLCKLLFVINVRILTIYFGRKHFNWCKNQPILITSTSFNNISIWILLKLWSISFRHECS